MQRKSKSILTKIIIVLILCSAVLYAALHVRIGTYTEPEKNDGHAAENTDAIEEIPPEKDPEPVIDENYEGVGFNLGEFLYKDIYVNGWHINNWELTDPFISVEGRIFVPMSPQMLKALGLKLHFDDEKHKIVLSPGDDPVRSGIRDGKNACNLQYTEVYWGHEYNINGEKAAEYSAATTKDNGRGRILYVSPEALEKYSGRNFSWYYDEISGLYISTDKGVSAQSMCSDNNRKYIEGRAEFMRTVNHNLDKETALRYEYIFRHEGHVWPYSSQDLLMSICKTESGYVHKAESSVEAIGLMQVMLVYAENDGYTREMMQDPHYNVERGAYWFNWTADQCDGDTVMSLSAYYMGVGGAQANYINTGSTSSNYSDVCISNMNMLQSWVEANGYSNTFLEYIGQ